MTTSCETMKREKRPGSGQAFSVHGTHLQGFLAERSIRTMGANLVPLVRGFRIEPRTFNASDCAVVENCVTVGARKLLRFDFLCWNAGDQDVHLGDPTQNPQWYEWSPCHRHWHLKNFNEYRV